VPNVTPAVPKFTQFVDSLAAGDIDTLFVIASNPAYSAPVDLDVARLLGDELKKPAAKRKSKKEWLAVHMGLYFDETATLCHWHVPQSHFLETWSDATAYDGVANIVQPLIAPLYDSKSPHDLFAALTRRDDFDNRSALDLVTRQVEKPQRGCLGPRHYMTVSSRDGRQANHGDAQCQRTFQQTGHEARAGHPPRVLSWLSR
jgi:anaerobic selenocysteine-containing dehydrogenase